MLKLSLKAIRFIVDLYNTLVVIPMRTIESLIENDV